MWDPPAHIEAAFEYDSDSSISKAPLHDSINPYGVCRLPCTRDNRNVATPVRWHAQHVVDHHHIVSATTLTHRTTCSPFFAMSSLFGLSPEMSAVRHNVAEIASCGCTAHTGFALPVAPQMFRCRGGDLSRAYSVGRPPCTPRQCVSTRSCSFGWMLYFFRLLWVASH